MLKYYDEFYIDYCQLVTDVVCIITFYVTIYCYILKRLIINSALEYLDRSSDVLVIYI